MLQSTFGLGNVQASQLDGHLVHMLALNSLQSFDLDGKSSGGHVEQEWGQAKMGSFPGWGWCQLSGTQSKSGTCQSASFRVARPTPVHEIKAVWKFDNLVTR